MDERLLALMAQSPASMGFSDLRYMRDRMGSRLDQELLAPFEHRAFAREWTQEAPWHALALMAAVPGYQLAKGFGLARGRSGASDPLGQMFSGFQGMIEGLR